MVSQTTIGSVIMPTCFSITFKSLNSDNSLFQFHELFIWSGFHLFS